MVKSFKLVHQNHHFGGISELWISKFSSTMVKSFTLVYQNPSLWGHFRAMNFKIFSTMVKSFKLVHENPSLWRHFWTMNLKKFFNHSKIFHTSPWKPFTLGAFQNEEFPNFFQPWWNHSLISIKIHQIPCVSIYKNWRPMGSHLDRSLYSRGYGISLFTFSLHQGIRDFTFHFFTSSKYTGFHFARLSVISCLFMGSRDFFHCPKIKARKYWEFEVL